MGIANLHAPLSNNAVAWLLFVAAPNGTLSPPSRPIDGREVADALYAAELHGILPAMFRFLAKSSNGRTLQGAASEAMDAARQRLAHQAGLELMLKHHAEKTLVALDAAGVPAVIVKGPVCARRLYAEPSLRMFTDIDVMIAVEAREEASAVMRSLNFELQHPDYRTGKDYFEDKWMLAGDLAISFEIHGDLVHNPKLRRTSSVTLEDIVEAGNGAADDATALLFVLAVHGAISHQFDRLQHLVDVALAASGRAGAIDVQRLCEIAGRCGVTTAVHAALAVAGNVFKDPACRALAEEIRPSRLDRFAGRLVRTGTVLRARSRRRGIGSWRRKALRQAIRAGGRQA